MSHARRPVIVLGLGALLSLLLPAAAAAHGVTDRAAAFVASIDGAAIGPFLYLGAKHMVTGFLDFDFHTEPAGQPPEASDSFERGNAAQSRGTYVAPYAGIHGWYWETPPTAR